MSVRLDARRSRTRAMTARFAIGGVAALAAAVTTAPMATADDDVTPTDPGTNQTGDPTPAPVDEPSTNETPVPDDQGPAAESTPSTTGEQPAPSAERAVAAAAAAVVPDFGFNKFRVGVRIADGSTVPSGVTTLGSTITIVETGPGVDDNPDDAVEGTRTTTCTTTIDEGAAGTFCDGLNTIGFGWDPALYPAGFGDVVTVTQTTVNPGLAIIDGVKVVVPTCDPQETNCGEGTNTGDVLLTDGVVPAPPADPAPKADKDDAAVLPDTGGSNVDLLALSLMLLGGGGWLVGKGRQPRRRSDAVV